VSCLQRFGDFIGNCESFIDGNGASLQSLIECFTLYEFHDDATSVAGLFQTVDVGDVGMVQ
jgi:hypothetical protein